VGCEQADQRSYTASPNQGGADLLETEFLDHRVSRGAGPAVERDDGCGGDIQADAQVGVPVVLVERQQFGVASKNVAKSAVLGWSWPWSPQRRGMGCPVGVRVVGVVDQQAHSRSA
jgi:hypothetical protein